LANCPIPKQKETKNQSRLRSKTKIKTAEETLESGIKLKQIVDGKTSKRQSSRIRQTETQNQDGTKISLKMKPNEDSDFKIKFPILRDDINSADEKPP
jgi:hypothetical protein